MPTPPAARILEVRPGLTIEKLAEAVSAGPAAGPTVGTDRFLLDTFDGRLYRKGLTLWRQDRRDRPPLLTLEGGAAASGRAPVTAELAAGDPRWVLVADLPEGELRPALAPVVEDRALLERVRVRVRSQALEVKNEDGKIVVRLSLDLPEVVGPGRRVLPLTRRLHVRPVLGYDRDLARAAARLAKGGTRAERATVAEEALRALGLEPAGVSSEVDVPLDRAMTAERAMRDICRRLVEVVVANLSGVVDDVDPEFLHDLRVAVRRSRSVLREMRGVLAPEVTARAREDLRWIQEVTGPTRDLDVMLGEWPAMEDQVPAAMRADLEPLRRLLQDQRASHFAVMRRQLRGQRYARAWSAWTEALDAAHAVPGPDSTKPVGALAGRRIISVYARMLEMGALIDDVSPAGSLHELRKRGKELRYLLELFGTMWPAETVKPLVGALKGLQDTLGHFQDDEIQIRQLRSMGPALAAQPGGTDSLIALGFVIDDLARSQARGRADFASRFAAFASPANRDLVASTFDGRRRRPAALNRATAGKRAAGKGAAGTRAAGNGASAPADGAASPGGVPARRPKAGKARKAAAP